MSLQGQSPHGDFNLRMLQVCLCRASDEANLLYLSLASGAATVLKQETPLQKTFCLTLEALHVPMSPAAAMSPGTSLLPSALQDCCLLALRNPFSH